MSSQLKEMFPGMEIDTLQIILEQCNNDLDLAIEKCLSFEPSDLKVAQELADADYAQLLQQEEHAAITVQPSFEQELSDDLTKVKDTVVDSAKMIGKSISTFYSSTKAEISKHLEKKTDETPSLPPRSTMSEDILRVDEDPAEYTKK